MTTNRTPIARRSTAMITPVALQAFRQILSLETQGCTCLPGREGECPRCTAWWAAQWTIHRELHLRPWQFPVEYVGMAEWEPDPAAVARWRLFEEAAREPEPRRRKRGRGAHVAASSER